MVGRHRVEVAVCTSEGQVYASCNECCAIRRDQYAAVTGAAAQADVGNGEDTLGGDDANGGVQADEYDAFFGDGPDTNFDLPTDSAVDAKAAAAIKTFNEKLA
jgi:hypothetical protein